MSTSDKHLDILKDSLIQAAWLRKAYQSRWQRLRCSLLHRWRWWGAIDHITHCYRCGAFVAATPSHTPDSGGEA